MPKKDTVFKGPCSSKKYKEKFIKLKNYTIIKSNIFGKVWTRNALGIRYHRDNIFIYHMYSRSDGRHGRWYNVDLKKKQYKLDKKKRVFIYTIPEYKNLNTGKTIAKNVKVKIYFTEKGWKQFLESIHEK